MMTAIVTKYNICCVLYTVRVLSVFLEVPSITQTLLSDDFYVCWTVYHCAN